MILRCLACFASNAYSCFSKAALTAMAVLKVLVTIAIITIVAVKLEDTVVHVDIPDLTTPDGLQRIRDSLGLGSSSTSVPPPVAPPSSVASPIPSNDPNLDVGIITDVYSVKASCLLQKKGQSQNLDQYSRTMCSYVYAVCGISLLATFVMACLLWCTCQLCGAGPIVELSFAVLGVIWWLTAVLVLQENTVVAVDTRPAVHDVIFGKAAPPPPFDAAAQLPPPSPPPPPLTNSTQSQLDTLYQLVQKEFTASRSEQQWRQALIGLSWAMMGMFAASAVLLLVEACGCVLDCCASMCRCCCCPDRPEARWRTNLRKRKRVGSDEYMEMCGGMPSSNGSIGSSGGAPAVMVVARSDDLSSTTSSASLPKASPRRGFCG